MIARGYVLVGGRSERMGADKATLLIAGRPMVEYAIATLREICSEVYLCGSRPDLAEYAPVLPDSRESAGPLTALVAAVQHAAELGGNAVVGARYDATEVMQGVTEVLAHGTAVFVEAAK